MLEYVKGDKMVKRFVTLARFKKFEIQQRNILIEINLLKKRVRDIEEVIFD